MLDSCRFEGRQMTENFTFYRNYNLTNTALVACNYSFINFFIHSLWNLWFTCLLLSLTAHYNIQHFNFLQMRADLPSTYYITSYYYLSFIKVLKLKINKLFIHSFIHTIKRITKWDHNITNIKLTLNLRASKIDGNIVVYF